MYEQKINVMNFADSQIELGLSINITSPKIS